MLLISHNYHTDDSPKNLSLPIFNQSMVTITNYIINLNLLNIGGQDLISSLR
jgi:hypothetical protein